LAPRTKVKTGWVVAYKRGLVAYKRGLNDNIFVNLLDDLVGLEHAWVYKTRKEARDSIKDNEMVGTDIVRKVRLDENNKPIEVIKGR
jgi:hypothetical protein